MTEEQLAKWVAEQVSHFKPGDLDAGIEIIRRHLGINRVERQTPN